MTTTITSLELENVKRVKAVQITPAEKGLTIIGGDNNQGKTSVLDSIMWLLGGDRYRPSDPQREGSVSPPHGKITLSNGLVVERKGKNSDLRVIDPSGNRAGQTLLNEFISTFALDLPKFMNGNSKEKAEILLQIIGVGEQLYELDQREKELYNKRHSIGQIAEQKKHHAEDLPVYPDAPDEIISATELITQQQEILARNGENQRKRELKDRYDQELKMAQTAYEQAKQRLEEATENAETASRDAQDLQDESTAELEANIASIDAINEKVRVNMTKRTAEAEAKKYQNEYEQYTQDLEAVRQEKRDLLDGADLPLEGLSVEDGELTYNGHKWDNISGSDQLKVATAIVRKLNSNCGFVLMDKLEQMDLDTLNEFGSWLDKEGLQVIATRVSKGEECSVIIEDGYSKVQQKQWKEGEF